MCGRIEYIVTSRTELEDRYGARMIEGYTERGVINARYNIPPSSAVPVLTSEEPDIIRLGHWGFVPTWSKDRKLKEVANARAETILQKPYFRSDIKTHRCLVPVTGFFEWHREGKAKRPYRFYTDDKIFSLAALYSMRPDTAGQERPHFALITTTANSVMAPVHERMPVIIDKSLEHEWLSVENDAEAIASLMRPYSAAHTHAYEISTLVNSPRNDSPEVIKPLHSPSSPK